MVDSRNLQFPRLPEEKPEVKDLEKPISPEHHLEREKPIENRPEPNTPEKQPQTQAKVGYSIGAITAEEQETKVREKKIEKILESGLEEIYLNLSPANQKRFKIEGEATIKEIDGLLAKTKINLGKIVDLIRKWLILVPGINKFFLEQEAKIKADEIIKLKENF